MLGAPGRALTFELLAEMEHRRWVAERLLAGWTYAPKKDIGRRENPHLVPWDRVKEEIKNYDRKTVRLIPSLLASTGKKLARRSAAFDEQQTQVGKPSSA